MPKLCSPWYKTELHGHILLISIKNDRKKNNRQAFMKFLFDRTTLSKMALTIINLQIQKNSRESTESLLGQVLHHPLFLQIYSPA